MEKDGWANLFDYMGSEENVRLKFAIDKIGVGLNETSIIFGDSRNGEAWDQFIASLKKEEEEKEEPAPVEETAVPEPPAVPFSRASKTENLLAFQVSLGHAGRRDWDRGGGDLENIFEPCPDRGCIR